MDASYVEHCKNILRKEGYMVIHNDRRILVQAQFIVPPHEMKYSRQNAERYADVAMSANQRRLICEAEANDLILHERKDIDDPVLGREVVFSSVMCLIKPKADGSSS